MFSKILIIDFGSQVTQLIARRVRELGVFSEIYTYNITDEFIRNYNPAGIILSGGPDSLTQTNTPRAPQIIFELGKPVLGICYGMQTMADQLGGKIEISSLREFGYAEVRIHRDTILLKDINDFKTIDGFNILKVWMSHGDTVKRMPPGFKLIASSNNCEIAAMVDETRHFYAVQFHPEVTHTISGKALLNNFVYKICRCKTNWNMPNYIYKMISKIRHQVNNEKVILGFSGGVDSCVAAVLIHQAIGNHLTCIFVDHGLLRLNENKIVIEICKNLGIKVIYVEASHQFISYLAGVTDPEIKRKIIGREFIKVFQKESDKLRDIKWLAQGTIYPDVIESAVENKEKNYTIKTHHNVGGLPKTLNLKLLEPLRELFKDEVRELGLALGISRDIVYRHPFPGPGLSVRILGEVKQEFINLLRLADAIFIDELHNTKEINGQSWYQKISQAFAVFLPIKSVGIMGDNRTYEYVIVLRAVQTTDFMTADWVYLPHDFLSRISNRIINEVHGINRVVYDISGKPPATIEWE